MRLQVPFMCGCVPVCVTFAQKMAFIMQNFILKGFLFIGVGVVSSALHNTSNPHTLIGFFVLILKHTTAHNLM
jgi:hypothetical protein